ncbi:TPA: hypothetical protein N0F65_001379 [Lagenidium giganteum]|uniref:DUF1772 domain-containing protein n=1 Tax=Lagenidium giganteum TaxID=4803 RepID=A0AAV2YXQ4_9STRA|nr:TPA: hypothetical protein N0F65_001379 [Lagenidium giganteum]
MALVLAKVTATGLAGVFSGAATFITLAQHPALLETDDVLFQAPFFRRMYFYAARMQAPLALGSGCCALVVGAFDRHSSKAEARLWLFSGALIVSIVPYTIARMLHVNCQLVDSKRCREHGNSWMQRMLQLWGRLHSVRTGVSLVAFTGMLLALSMSPERQVVSTPVVPV